MTKKAKFKIRHLWYLSKISKGVRFIYLAHTLFFIFSWIWIFKLNVSNIGGGDTTLHTLQSVVFLSAMGLYFLIFTPFYNYVSIQIRHDTKTRRILKLALYFGLFEYVLHLSFNLFYWNNGSRIDTRFGFGSIAHIPLSSDLINITKMVGFYGVVALTAALIGLVCLKKRSALIVMAAFLSLYGISKIGTNTKNIATKKIVYISYNRDIKYQSISQALDNNGQDMDLLVLPEYGYYDMLPDEVEDVISRSKLSIGTVKIGKGVDKVNRFYAYDSQKNEIESFDKNRLVIFGEYLPESVRIFMKYANLQGFLDNFDDVRTFHKGNKDTKLIQFDGAKYGSFICSSITNGNDYQQMTKQGANVLTNSASLNLFGGSGIFDWQYDNFARFIASSNNRYYIQSSDGGPAMVIDNQGHIISKISYDSSAVQVPLIKSKNPYIIFGEWTLYAGLILFIRELIKSILKRRMARQNK